MYKLTINRFFDYSHQLPDSEDLITKACSNYHGHTALCRVEIYSKDNYRHGMVVDFKGIKNIIDWLDHKFINQVLEDSGLQVPSTAENIAEYIYNKILKEYPDLQEGLKVSICEGYKGEENSSWVTYYEG